MRFTEKTTIRFDLDADVRPALMKLAVEKGLIPEEDTGKYTVRQVDGGIEAWRVRKV